MIKKLQAIHRFLDVSRLRRFGFSLLLMVIAAGIDRVWLIGHPRLACAVLTVAAMVGAWFGGRGPGLFSTLLVPVGASISFAAVEDSSHPTALLLWTVLAGAGSFLFARLRLATLRRWRQQAMQALPLWEEDAQFNAIMQTVQYTLVDRPRCYMLYQMARQATQMAGEVAEVGVYKGGTGTVLWAAVGATNRPSF